MVRPVTAMARPLPTRTQLGAVILAAFVCWVVLLFVHPAAWPVHVVAAVSGFLFGLIPTTRLIYWILRPILGFAPSAFIVTNLYASAPAGTYFVVLGEAAAVIFGVSSLIVLLKSLGR
jgi:hypothetical protein